jgi:glycosyltransferase involved in cell wall biosynthesis
MACYNAMPYLPEAISSILNQSFRDFTLIVVDDGSTDGSSDYLAKVAPEDSRLRVVRQTNQGQQAAANLGITLGSSEYIVRMDADDIADLRRLERQVGFMDANPDVGLSGGQLKRMGSQKTGLVSNLPLDHDSIVAGLVKNHHTMCNGTCIFRRQLFLQLGGYWEHNISEDWDLFLRFSEVSKLANQEHCFLAYRLHRASVNGRRIVEAQLFNEYAAERYRRRGLNLPEISYQEFLGKHQYSRWLGSWSFYLDAQSIGEYRRAIADVYSGHPIQGYLRLGVSMAMSPGRTLRRLVNILAGWLNFGPQRSASVDSAR